MKKSRKFPIGFCAAVLAAVCLSSCGSLANMKHDDYYPLDMSPLETERAFSNLLKNLEDYQGGPGADAGGPEPTVKPLN